MERQGGWGTVREKSAPISLPTTQINPAGKGRGRRSRRVDEETRGSTEGGNEHEISSRLYSREGKNEMTLRVQARSRNAKRGSTTFSSDRDL